MSSESTSELPIRRLLTSTQAQLGRCARAGGAFGIPQVVALNDVSDRPLLPSFLYLPAAKEFPPGGLELPWKTPPDRVAGTFARDHGAKVPGRLVGSAKSWLSHPGVDRRLADPAMDGAGRRAKVSPVDASAAYLEHLRDAWNARNAGKARADRLENQDILLTVPASFDPVAAS